MMKYAIQLLSIAILLAGCTSASALVDKSPEPPDDSPAPTPPTTIKTLTPQAVASPTRTAVPASPTLTATSPTTGKMKRQCLEITHTLPPNIEMKGPVVLGLGYMRNPPFLLDVTSKRKIYLSRAGADDYLQNIHVSPDQNWLAYRNVSLSQLIIASADGQSHRILAWEESWRLISGWLDNERLLISRKRGDDLYDSLIVLNPFSDQQQNELLPDYPDIVAWYPDPNWSWFDASKTVYSSDLSRVIYPGLTLDDSPRLFLRNLETNSSIMVITGTLSFGVTPLWSPDGQRFIISGPSTLLSMRPQPDPLDEHQELFSISRDGKISQLTRLSDQYSYVSFDEYAWSPDSRYVAFGLRATPISYPNLYPTTKPEVPGRLVVLDTISHEITDYCVPRGETRAAPVWSPNSLQIIIEDYYQSHPPYKGNVYLVDIANGFSAQIAEDVTPLGWMRSIP